MEVSIYSVIFSKVMALAAEGKLVNYSKKRNCICSLYEYRPVATGCWPVYVKSPGIFRPPVNLDISSCASSFTFL